jgi:hypothetical protein
MQVFEAILDAEDEMDGHVIEKILIALEEAGECSVVEAMLDILFRGQVEG